MQRCGGGGAFETARSRCHGNNMLTHNSSIRVKKLRETLVAVQQLEKKMSSLRSWLSHIEMELSRPIVYDTCDEKEIEKKLNQQQVNATTHKTVRGSTYIPGGRHHFFF